MKNLSLLLILPLALGLTGCDPAGSPDDDSPAIDFDRQEMLRGWAENVIAPRQAALLQSLTTLAESLPAGDTTLTDAGLATLEANFRNSYRTFQELDPVLFGKAEELQFRTWLNTYPTDPALIEENVSNGGGNLVLPSQITAQGFPALDYLLFGDAVSLQDSPAHRREARRLVLRMQALAAELVAAWTPAEIDAYVANDGNSATASIDRTVNDYIFYFEKFLRAGKVGIPAGVFSDDPLADRVESRYGGDGKNLLAVALDRTRRFFVADGLRDYLDALAVRRDGELLSTQIVGQFDAIAAQLDNTGEDLGEQVRTDNGQLLALYDELQRLVVLLKVDMLQALSINVDYVDADGD